MRRGIIRIEDAVEGDSFLLRQFFSQLRDVAPNADRVPRL
jgi:hypothetical protein